MYISVKPQVTQIHARTFDSTLPLNSIAFGVLYTATLRSYVALPWARSTTRTLPRMSLDLHLGQLPVVFMGSSRVVGGSMARVDEHAAVLTSMQCTREVTIAHALTLAVPMRASSEMRSQGGTEAQDARTTALPASALGGAGRGAAHACVRFAQIDDEQVSVPAARGAIVVHTRGSVERWFGLGELAARRSLLEWSHEHEPGCPSRALKRKEHRDHHTQVRAGSFSGQTGSGRVVLVVQDMACGAG